jgi:two-component system, OmpR family, osmolarity sensor histidine kinase EnvZ
MLKRFLPTTLFGRSLAIMITPVVLLQIVATYVFYERHWYSVTRRLSQGLAGDIAMIVDMHRDTKGADLSEVLKQRIYHNMQIRANFVRNEILPNQPPQVSVTNRILDQVLDQALNDRFQRPYRMDTASFGRDIEVRIQFADGVLQVLTPRKRVTSPTTYIFIMWMVGASLLFLTIAVLFLRNQIKPIRRLSEAVDQFGKGGDVGDLKPRGASEVRQATVAFLRMRDRIRRQIDQRTEMLAGVSHDLRTPLTRMKLQLEMLDDAAESDHLKADVADMERMVDSYLDFARGQDTEASSLCDLGVLVSDVAMTVRRDGGNVEVHIPDNPAADPDLLKGFVRPVALKRCLSNLMSNARRHADHISVTVDRDDTYIHITIDDDGPGIPADKRKEVFRPFRRLDESRNLESGGSGLGLAIARDVARNHGGDIILGDSDMGGLRALVRLPV